MVTRRSIFTASALFVATAFASVVTIVDSSRLLAEPVNDIADDQSPGFVPMTPERILDTRTGVGAPATRIGSVDGTGPRLELDVLSAGIPVDATAVAMNVTVVDGVTSDFGGYVTVYPCGELPDASNLNFVTGQTVPNMVIAPISAEGTICFHVFGTAHLLADVSGYLTNGYVPMTPERILDTRTGVGTWMDMIGGTTRLGLPVTIAVTWNGVPDGSAAVVMNVTVVDGVAGDYGGYLTVYPCGEEPDASNLNFVTGQTVPNMVIAPLSNNGTVCFQSFGKAHLLADLSGYFPGESELETVISPFPNRVPVRKPDSNALSDGLGLVTSASEWWDRGFYRRDTPVSSISKWSMAQRAAVAVRDDGRVDVATLNWSNKVVTVRRFGDVTLTGEYSELTIDIADWERFGGMHVDSEGFFYLLLGQTNYDQDDDKVVVEVRRHDQDFELVGTARVRGGIDVENERWGIYDTFEFAAGEMLLVDDRLVVHMARRIYLSADGLHHQVNLTFEVDIDSMAVTNFGRDRSYSSHSFRQALAMHDGTLFMADHGDAYPRSVVVGVMPDYPTSRSVEQFDLLQINGDTGDNFTGVILTDLVAGDGFVHATGTSIRQPNAPLGPLGSDDEAHNAYVATLDLASETSSVRWLTEVAPTSDVRVGEPRMIGLDDDRSIVLFEVLEEGERRLEYRLLDGDGSVIGSRTFDGMRFLPAHRPMIVDEWIYWISLYGDGGSDGSNPSLFNCNDDPWDSSDYSQCVSYSIQPYALDIGNPIEPELIRSTD
jgi:hypothetical protein